MDCYYLLIIFLIIKQYSTNNAVTLNDETPINVKVLDLKTLTSTSNKKMTFHLLKGYKAHGYFKIKDDNLYTSQLIDMDTLCQKIEECCDKERESCDVVIGVGLRESQESDLIRSTIKIIIRDKNDNTPVFPDKYLEIKISESVKTGDIFHLPMATDNDFGTNRVENYKIDRQEPRLFDQYFRLQTNKQSNSMNVGLKLCKQLDREVISKYSFNLLAIDGAYSESKTGSINITIKITDENDNMPQFTQTVYKETVKEGIMNPSSILQLSATDPDENNNGKIIYKFNPNNKDDHIIRENFSIDEENGYIYLRQKLNFEKLRTFKFTVIAINPTPPVPNSLQTSTATVEINVENVYDEQLSINVDYLNNNNYSIVEENKNNIFVALVTVESRDSDQHRSLIQCNLEGFGDTLQLITKEGENLKVKTYEIRTIREIDRELLPKITTKVMCKEFVESYIPWVYATIDIFIKDQNDNAPSLRISGNQYVFENDPIGKTVLSIKAEDKDEGDNGKITFSMDKSPVQSVEYLIIGETDGVIKIKSLIDCETTQDQIKRLSVIVTGTDHGNPPKSNDISFNINVMDVNDNIPKFSSSEMHFTVMENNPTQVSIGEIEVEDRDTGDKINLVLSKQNSVQLPFVIVPKSKRIFLLNTTRSLDRERDEIFKFEVLASDGGDTKAHTITGTVEVEVLDENDNFPIIIFPPQNNATNHVISYLEPKNYRFMTVSANDQDKSPEFNALEFSLEGEVDIFDIDKQEGSIYTRRTMSSKDVGYYTIRIVVSNGGNSKMKSSVSVNINIDKSLPKSKYGRHESKTNIDIGFSSSPGSYTSSDIIIVILIVIVLFVVFIIICFVCLGLRHCNKDPICLRGLLDKCFHSDISEVENNVYNTTQNNNSKVDLDYYKDLSQKATIRREPSDNWSHPNHIDPYHNPINRNQYAKQTYTKLSNQYYVHTPAYQTIDDNLLNKTFLSLHHRRKFEPNYKSEMNLNTENLFKQSQELCQINEQAKVQLIASLTPMPTRSKSVVNRIISNDQVENNFAVVYPQEQSTFV